MSKLQEDYYRITRKDNNGVPTTLIHYLLWIRQKAYEIRK